MTAPRSPRSAELFVGSTPGTVTNVHSAGHTLSRFFEKPRVSRWRLPLEPRSRSAFSSRLSGAPRASATGSPAASQRTCSRCGPRCGRSSRCPVSSRQTTRPSADCAARSSTASYPWVASPRLVSGQSSDSSRPPRPAACSGARYSPTSPTPSTPTPAATQSRCSPEHQGTERLLQPSVFQAFSLGQSSVSVSCAALERIATGHGSIKRGRQFSDECTDGTGNEGCAAGACRALRGGGYPLRCSSLLVNAGVDGEPAAGGCGLPGDVAGVPGAVSYTHLRAHETDS